MSTSDGFRLDTSRWPLAVVHSPRRPITDEEIEEFVKAQRAMLERGERYIELADTTGVHMLPPSQRKRMADFLRETDARGTELCAGLAIVIGNPVLRGGMTAIFWIFRPSYPIRAVGSIAEAAEFLTNVAAAAGLPLSASAREFLSGASEGARP